MTMSDPLTSARDAYKVLQEKGSTTVSDALNRSSQIFQQIVNQPVVAANERHKETLKQAVAQHAIGNPTGSKRSVELNEEKPCLAPAAPLLGEETHDAQFLCLVTELMKPAKV